MHSSGRSALLLLSTISLTLWLAGCVLHTPQITPGPQSTPQSPLPSPTPKQGIGYRITHPFAGLHFFHQKPPPPKAMALRRIGIVRTLSQDGTYVIVELEPGVLVTPGTELFVTATGGEPARLKVSDLQPPYFAADIVSGTPEPGDPVRQ